MGKLFFAVVAAIASFALVESLTCNRCSASVLGLCLSGGETTCTVNQTCYTGKISFPSFTSFKGVVQQGCRANDTSCNTNTTSSMVFINVKAKIACCGTDKCNKVDLTGAAPDLKMTFLVTIAGAAMASMWGSFL